ncbi:nitroreductase [Oceaniserpentilla sp. 4NH20-0058]|uniref:nitroreductase n=1 Tax=Oceaniserpentilla sp. 4NH20-0058 TaxID=3127660 RepID=UPI00310696C1
MQQLPSMSLVEAIQNRRSIRGFKKDQIEPSILQEILTLAQRSPSNCNVQPWQVLLASGSACDELRTKLLSAFSTGQSMKADFPTDLKFEGILRTRQIECAQALYGAMGIERHDKIGRAKATARNYEFFGAPHVLFITMKKSFNEAIAVDIGIYAQTLMLVMTAYGIGSCAQASVAYYPDIIRDFFDLKEDDGILFGISFGYEDKTIDANKTRTQRANIEEVVSQRPKA